MLFDAAGTLIHLCEPVGETYARFARQHGVEASAEQIQRSFGACFRRMPAMAFSGPPPDVAQRERGWWRTLVDGVFRSLNVRDQFADFDTFFAALFDHFAEAATWRAAPHTTEALSALRALGLTTGIVSNFDRRLLAILDGLGLSTLLDVVVLPSDAGAAKPSPRIFHFALERLGVAADHALYVGDDADDDIEGARQAGLRSLDVRTLHGVAEIATSISRFLPPDA